MISKSIVIILSIILLIPLIWMISGSFKSPSEAIKVPPSLIPAKPTIENFQLLFKYPALAWIKNSFIVCISVTFLLVLFNTATGYGFAKKKFRGENLIFWMFLVCMMIPGQIKFIPLYLMIWKFGLYDRLLGLIIPFMVSPFWIFFYRQYLKRFPDEMLQAAEIDGAGELRKFFQIILPLSKPAVTTIALITFISTWNSFLWQIILISTEKKKTLIVGVAEIVWAESTASALINRLNYPNYGLICAGALTLFIPLFFIFILFHRKFASEIFSGGFK